MKPQHVFRLREAFQEAIRSFFKNRGSIETPTPCLVLQPGTEVHLRYFETTYLTGQGSQKKLYLRSSPELHMKQLLSEDLPKIYQISTSFRNFGERADWHHPEFSLLEFYEKDLDLEGLMELTHEFILFMQEKLLSLSSLHDIPSLTPKTSLPTLQKISLYEAFETFAQIPLVDQDPNLALKGMEKKILSLREDDDFETAFFKIMMEKIEPQFKKLQYLALYDYPPSQAALATVKNNRAQRMEFYLDGIELCNGFQELLGQNQNRERMETSQKQRALFGYENPPLDPFFLQALEFFPPCSGNALGLDRLLALLLNLPCIDPIMPFRNQGY